MIKSKSNIYDWKTCPDSLQHWQARRTAKKNELLHTCTADRRARDDLAAVAVTEDGVEASRR
jgi:hypothetical protein